MNKIAIYFTTAFAATTLAGCGTPKDKNACSSIKSLEQVVVSQNVASQQIEDEIMDDLAEEGSKHDCPGYEGMDDE